MKNLRIILAIVIVWQVQTISFGQIFIQSEDYSNMYGVQTEGCADYGGGLNVGWIDNNDWLEYEVDVPMAGEYVISLRTASLSGGGLLSISNMSGLLGNISISATGAWQNWQTITGTAFTLNAGLQTIRLTASSGGFNLNWFEIKLVDPADSDLPTTPSITESHSGVHTVDLKWDKSSDPSTVITGYKLFNEDNFIAFTKDTSFSLTKLPPATTLTISIRACDLAGNQSAPETIIIETTAITWPLAWSDEFDGTEVDTDKWNFQVGGDGWGNGEAQYYTNGNNAKVENGNLIIEARKETVGSNQFTSSRMNNANKGDFLYGRIEVRAMLPSTGGTWPAIWTLPTEWSYGNWPDCGEIDIMEHTGNNLNYVFGTIHTGAYNHMEGTAQSGGQVMDDVVNTFHTYTLEWYPDHLDWYYDDQIVFTYENKYETFAEWPFDIPHHVLLNVAIGGGLGGNIDYNGVWPQQMKVDYVRIYDFDLGAGDIIAPDKPTNLQAESDGININLSWAPSVDNEYVKKYYIYMGNEVIDSVSGTKYTVNYLEPITEYLFSVEAIDFGGNRSEKANINATTGEIEAIVVPGIFEAEEYLYMYGMETENCLDTGGGINMAHIAEGDWLEYYINVADEGEYFLWTRAASFSRKGRFAVLNEKSETIVTVETPITGGWQNWETSVSERFTLEAGSHRIKMKALTREFNLNWFMISPDSLATVTSINAIPENDLAVYPNPFNGQQFSIDFKEKISSVEIGIHLIEGRSVIRREFHNVGERLIVDGLNLNTGLYVVQVAFNNYSVQYLMVVK